MRHGLIKTLSLLVLGFLARPLSAQELYEPFIAVRPSAVGGAFTAIANDENATWTNPAGITRIRKARSRRNIDLISAPNLILGANSKSREFVTVLNSGSSAGVEQVAAQADSLGSKPFWAYTGLAPMSFLEVDDVPMIVGLYSANTLSSALSAVDSSVADTHVYSDLGVIVGAAYDHPSHRLSLGITTRYMTRYAFEDKIPLTVLSDPKSLQTAVKNGANKSAAFAYDLGFLWTLADFWFPTFGVAILNGPTGCKGDYLNPYSKKRERTCGTKYSGSFANAEALSTLDPTDIRVGLSITPRFGRSFATKIALDAHHLATMVGGSSYGLQNIAASKKLHAGIEFFTGNPLTPPPFSIGFGMSQGFYTFGMKTQISKMSLEFASLGKDISASAGPLEDRRYLGSLSFMW